MAEMQTPGRTRGKTRDRLAGTDAPPGSALGRSPALRLARAGRPPRPPSLRVASLRQFSDAETELDSPEPFVAVTDTALRSSKTPSSSVKLTVAVNWLPKLADWFPA